jgi:hypothetical protein
VEGDTTEFVGMKSIASDPEKTDFFAGIGFARHDYRLADGLKCTRMISVMPSGESGEASPAFLLSFIIRNTSSQAKRFSYDEIVLPNFVPMDSQYLPAEERAFRYPYQTLVTFRTVEAKFGPIPQVFVPSYTPETPFAHEVAPKPLFVYSPDAFLCIYHGEIHAKIDSRVRAGEEKRFDMVIGLADENFKKNAEMMKTQAIEVAKQNQRTVIDIETLRKTTSDLLATVEGVQKAQLEGAQKRAAAEQELFKLEKQMSQTAIGVATSTQHVIAKELRGKDKNILPE